jgi:uncharacterized protein (TIGR03437 family)
MKLREAFLYLCLVLAATALAQFHRPNTNGHFSSKVRSAGIRGSANLRAVESYGKLPLSFEANRGQTDPEVKFLTRGGGYNLFLTSTEAVLNLKKPGVRKGPQIGGPPDTGGIPPISPIALSSAKSVDEKSEKGAVLRMKLVGANPSPQVAGAEELPGKSNYFIGNDPAKWRTNVPTYAKVKYEDVYPGIDLVYYGNQRQLEYDFVVSPGADPRSIRLAFQSRDSNGAVPLRIDNHGDVVLGAEGSELRLHRPIIYQEISGSRQRIGGNFVIHGLPSEASAKEGRQIGFEVARYDASKPLIIDPVLSYSTYLGGNSAGYGIAVDSFGNAYVTGVTTSTNFPTANAFQAAIGGGTCYYSGGPSPCSDVFVTKLNATGSALVYSTYLGGSGNDWVSGIAVDSFGNAYVTGQTFSTDFPTANAFQAACSGNPCGDAFVTKLNAAGSALAYSTYLGGSGNDQGTGIAVDSSGNAYVTGSTASTNFPTANAFQATNSSGGWNAFVTKFNTAGSALAYSTYLGGSSGQDFGSGIAVDSSGNAYVTGSTQSTNFPTTANAFQAVNRGGVNGTVFVTKLSAAGSALTYSTYLGGSGGDFPNGIAVDSSGNAYVTGSTTSSNFPIANAFQAALGSSGEDAFVTKLNAAGSALIYSTYLGGSGGAFGISIAVDSSGNAYVTGNTASSNFPTTADAFQTVFGGGVGIGDAFVTKLNAAGSSLAYSTYLGGSDIDAGKGIAVDSSGNAYVTGFTSSTDFPTTANTFQGTYGSGFNDAFVTKISPAAPGSPTILLDSVALSFAATAGGASPASKTVSVSNSGGGTLNWTATSSTTSGGNWLGVSPASGTNSGTLTVSANIAGLAAGSYKGNIQVAATGASNTPQNVAVTLTVQSAPPPPPPTPTLVLSLSTNALSFTTLAGSNPPGQSLQISNSAAGVLSWTISVASISGGNWLTLGSTSGQGNASVPVTVNSAVLQAGKYTAVLTVRASNAVNSPQNVTVSLTVTAKPTLGANPSSLSFSGSLGSSPAAQSLAISGSEDGLSWTASASTSSGGNWLNLSATSGVTPSSVTVSVNTAGLAAGTYTGTITISAAGVASQAVAVTLAVIASPVPTPTVSSIVNGASFAAGSPVAPGSIISIFGSNLATSAAGASGTPLPTELLTTTVAINRVPIPLYYVSPTQINAQVPFETPPGTAVLAGTANGALIPAVTFPVAATAPGIFQYGTNRAVAVNPDGSINASDHPAKPGDVIVVYMTGQGAVSNPIPSGAPALGNPLSETVATTTATIGGASAEVLFSGLAPSFVGLLQANIRIPNVAAGDRALLVTIGGAASQSALITVASP